jgi:hypothetical protein
MVYQYLEENFKVLKNELDFEILKNKIILIDFFDSLIESEPLM